MARAKRRKWRFALPAAETPRGAGTNQNARTSFNTSRSRSSGSSETSRGNFPPICTYSPLRISIARSSRTSIDAILRAAALIFNRQFFPELDPVAGTLAAFGAYVVGFAARPFGGLLFGHFGDKLGRKEALIVSMLIMGGSTAVIGLLPTYETIGIAAPILLVLLRLLQGIALGGETGGAVLISVEHSSAREMNFYGSFPQMGVPAGTIIMLARWWLAAAGSVTAMTMAKAAPSAAEVNHLWPLMT